MQSRKGLVAVLLLSLAGVGITVGGRQVKPPYQKSEKAYYLSDVDASFVRPGLRVQVQKVALTPPSASVTFRIADDQDQGLDRSGIQTPGTVALGFILARIKPGDTQYSVYTFRDYDSPTRGPIVIPWTDTPEGTYTSLGDGVYQYTFSTQLPSDYDANSTTTLGVQAARDLTSFGLSKYVANVTYDFVPSGALVTQVRDIVRTENCNQCHDPLAVHGGNRRDTKLCVLCHQPQNTDVFTSIPADFKVMIHKIHMGANLPSVTRRRLNVLGTSGSGTATTASGATQGPVEEGVLPAGTPYKLVNSDFSTVVWPQDVRNCTTCHQKGTQSDNWKTNPSRAACGSCHDDVNFDTGQNHAGGVRADDSQCSICHPPDTGLEFDLSVAGAHTMPWKSKQLAGLKLEITEVTGTKPGDKPTVSFKVSDNKGNPVDATKLTSLGFNLAGPTTDYTFVTRGATGSPATENALPTVRPTRSGFTYTFATALPQDAKGSFAVGAVASRNVTIRGSLVGQSFSVNEYAFNPVFYFSVDGSRVVPRRQVVDVNKCNVCHDQLALHGGPRRNASEFCEMCHNPANTDDPNGSRNAGFKVPVGIAPQSINFRFMPHRIHSGKELTRDFTIYRTIGVFNYNGLRFPGDRRDCAKCHVNKSNELPLPKGLANALAPREFYSPLGPTASACLGCHDKIDAAAHTYLMTAPFAESCPVCHEEGADFAVSKVHAR